MMSCASNNRPCFSNDLTRSSVASPRSMPWRRRRESPSAGFSSALPNAMTAPLRSPSNTAAKSVAPLSARVNTSPRTLSNWRSRADASTTCSSENSVVRWRSPASWRMPDRLTSPRPLACSTAPNFVAARSASMAAAVISLMPRTSVCTVR
jgi:hypothetical protein